MFNDKETSLQQTAIEQAVYNNAPITLPGSIHLQLEMLGANDFIVQGLNWVDANGELYRPWLRCEARDQNTPSIGLYVVGSVAPDGVCTGNTMMFRPEHRHHPFQWPRQEVG